MARTSTAPQAPEKKSNGDFVNFTGISMYARLNEPKENTTIHGEPTAPIWTQDVLIDSVTAAMLKGKGVRVKSGNQKYLQQIEQQGLASKGYMGDFVTTKKSTVKKVYVDGVIQRDKQTGDELTEAADRPKMTDSRGREIPESAGLNIGNGSTVRIGASITKGPKVPVGNYGLRLIETRILELVEFAPANQGNFTYGETEEITKTDFEDEMPF